MKILTWANELRDLPFLNSLHAQYTTLQGSEHWDDDRGRKGYIAKLEKSLARGRWRSNFSSYYLNALTGMSKYIFTKDYAGALGNFKTALQHINFNTHTAMDRRTGTIFHPDKFLIFRHMAAVCRLMKDYAQADMYITRGITADPKDYEFRIEKLYMRQDQKDYPAVLQICDEIEALCEKHSQRMHYADFRALKYARVEAHMGLKNYDEALTCDDQLIRTFPSEKPLIEAHKNLIHSMRTPRAPKSPPRGTIHPPAKKIRNFTTSANAPMERA